MPCKHWNAKLRGGYGLLAVALAWALAGCGGMVPRGGGNAQSDPDEVVEAPQRREEAPASSKRFEDPGELDKLLDAKPIALAAVKPASQATPSGAGTGKSTEPVSKGKGNFRIQLGAESDVDAAQAKKQEYEKALGGTVDVVFDAPYYKLRWGYFDSRQDAEDKVLEMSDLKIQMFVIKQ